MYNDDKIETLECLDMNTVSKYIPGVFETFKAKYSFKKEKCKTTECCKQTCAEICSTNRNCDANWENICETNCDDIVNHLFPKIDGPEYVTDIEPFPYITSNLHGRFYPNKPLSVIYPSKREPLLYENNETYSILRTQFPYINTPDAYDNYSYMYLKPKPQSRMLKNNPRYYKNKNNY